MEFQNAPAKIMISSGIILLVIGLIWNFFGNSLKLGHLPGDISVEKENFKFYFPLTTSILISVVISLMIWLFRFFKGNGS
jgi:hypothetical protein